MVCARFPFNRIMKCFPQAVVSNIDDASFVWWSIVGRHALNINRQFIRHRNMYTSQIIKRLQVYNLIYQAPPTKYILYYIPGLSTLTQMKR